MSAPRSAEMGHLISDGFIGLGGRQEWNAWVQGSRGCLAAATRRRHRMLMSEGGFLALLYRTLARFVRPPVEVANKLAPESPAMAYVLVVDDEPSIRQLLTRCLQGWGYAVQQASNATEALDVMLAEPASIMLCDIRMPGHDGLWLVERVRARWPRTAIIMATCVDDLQTVLQARREGVTDYVTKPFGRELLLQALGRAKAALKE